MHQAEATCDPLKIELTISILKYLQKFTVLLISTEFFLSGLIPMKDTTEEGRGQAENKKEVCGKAE
jgi:hypothetical protein